MAAAAAATPKKPQDGAPKPPRVFSFEPTFSVPVPAITAAPRSNALPFKGMFDSVEDKAREGKDPHFFIPTAFWTEDRKADPAKVNGSYAKGKIRDQFNAWQKTNVPNRGNLKLVMVDRTGKEQGFPEPGVSFWITKPAA